MKILHSSDWHIGSTLYNKKRHGEYAKFFTWLIDFIEKNAIDVLLVSGDIFDTVLPNNTAQNLYYSFLIRLHQTTCRHLVITGGNHDSPSFLNAPKELLKSLNIHVIGEKPENISEELIVIDEDGEELIILAVPYLRERDLPYSNITDDYETRANKIVQGIKAHYQELTELALDKAKDNDTLIIAMGHFYVAGSKLAAGNEDCRKEDGENDGERELYIGSLAQISAEIFPKELDYIAMGHIHSAQKIAQSDYIRYCGSPLPMSFCENAKNKKIIVLDTKNKASNTKFSVTEHSVPEFQIIRKIHGDLEKINQETEKMKSLNQSVWLEVEYNGQEFSGTETNPLKEYLAAITKDTEIEVLKFKNQNIIHTILENQFLERKLEELTPLEIFQNILDSHEFTDEKKQGLLRCYQEILNEINEIDINE